MIVITPQSVRGGAAAILLAVCVVSGTGVAADRVPSAERGPERPVKMRGFYGFNPKEAPFAGMAPERIADALSGWGVDFVVGGSRDKAVAAALQDRGIRIFAVLDCFQGESHWKSRPESRPIRADGKPLSKVRWYAGVCPSQSWLRRRILREAAALARKPELAGVWLDFIRYPVHWEVRAPDLPETCFCPVCLDKFQREAGIRLPGRLDGPAAKARWILLRHARAWTDWRADNIAGFVGQVRRAIRRERPGFRLGLFVLPWGPEEFSGAMTRVAGQDIEKLAAEADILSPMAYHTLVGRPVQWVHEVARRLADAGGKPVWPIVLAGEGKDAIPHEELRRAVRFALQEPSQGVLVFPQRVLALPEHRAGLPRLFPTADGQPKR
ncbi:MAG: hypothetical protein ABII00_04925 [Elusimicrobiota bacterium]